MAEQVECRSDWEYAQQPLAFTWQGSRLVIQQVLAGYHTPTGRCFLVSTVGGERFELFYAENLDQWSIHPKPSKESI